MTVFEHVGRLLIVDCGVLFPEDDQPGVDLILPDFRAIEDRLDDIDALVLTHGHEDHIGAVPFLLQAAPRHPGRRLPVHAGAGRREVPGAPPATRTLVEVAEGERRSHGVFELRVLRRQPLDPGRARGRHPHRRRARAAHRRHQARPAAARRPAHRPGRVLAARRRGRRPVPGATRPTPRCPGSSCRSARSARCCDGVIRGASSGSSSRASPRHVHRVQQILDVAVQYEPQGRVRRPVDGAQHGHRGRPRLPQRARRAVRRPRRGDADCRRTRCSSSPPGRRASRCRRCRGWRAASTGRSSIREGDTVDPGVVADPRQRERRLRRRQRAGQARRDASCTRATPRCTSPATRRPASCCSCTTRCGRRNVMPVHGEWRHLRANAALAVRTGVAEDHVVIAEDGVVVDLVDGKAAVSRPRRGRARVRRRPVGRRRRRVDAVRPAGAGRGRLHLDHRRHRPDARAGR